MAIACLFLASKVDECKRVFRNFVNVYHHLLQPTEPPLVLSGNEYWEIRRNIVRAERLLLREIGFDTAVEHPHKFILNYKRILRLDNEVTQYAWGFANDR
jgi:cyclin L